MFLPVFVELPLIPKEDEHQWDIAEPDFEIPFPTMATLLEQAMSHET